MQELSYEEGRELLESLEKKAEALAAFYRSLGYRGIDGKYFLSSFPLPCRFSYDSYNTFPDPKTGKKRRCQKIPQGFRDCQNSQLNELYHFSPAGCWSLRPFYSVVDCLALISYRYWLVTRHRVGECPHKHVLVVPPDPPPRELPPDMLPPYISEAIISHDFLFLKPALDGRLPGEFPKEYRRKNLPLAQYLEYNGSLIWLFEYSYNLSKIQKFFRRHPRPANQEVFPRVAIYDESYWKKRAKKRPLRVVENVTLIELLEILKEFAPPRAR